MKARLHLPDSHEPIAREHMFWDLCCIAGMWFLLNAVCFYWLTTAPYYHWEKVEVRKLLDYGFWQRQGAILSTGWRFGWLERPELHNYVNHNYPVLWLYAVAYYLFGPIGIHGVVAIRSLLTQLFTYASLIHIFPRKTAFLTTILGLATCGIIEYTMHPDVIGQGVIVWPVATLLALRFSRRPSGKTAFLLGVIVFLAGQISWFTLSVLPCVALLCKRAGTPLRIELSRPLSNPAWVWLAFGAIASICLFIAQILYYSPSIKENIDYLKLQTVLCPAEAASRLDMLPVLILRTLLTCPALWFGACIWLFLRAQFTPYRGIATVAVLYYIIFVTILVSIPRLLFLNQHGFSYLIFPGMLLTGIVLACLHSQWIRIGLFMLTFLGLSVCYAKLYDYRASAASVAFGQWLAEHTGKDELIFSNYTYKGRPRSIEAWDYEFITNASCVGDRLLFSNTTRLEQLWRRVAEAGSLQPRIAYILFPTPEIEQSLYMYLINNHTDMFAVSIRLPEEPMRVFKSARQLLWHLLPSATPWRAARPDRASSSERFLTFIFFRFYDVERRETNRD